MPHHCMVKVTSHTSSYLMGGSQTSMEADRKLSHSTLSSSRCHRNAIKKGSHEGDRKERLLADCASGGGSQRKGWCLTSPRVVSDLFRVMKSSADFPMQKTLASGHTYRQVHLHTGPRIRAASLWKGYAQCSAVSRAVLIKGHPRSISRQRGDYCHQELMICIEKGHSFPQYGDLQIDVVLDMQAISSAEQSRSQSPGRMN
jgi:hypothetical protein